METKATTETWEQRVERERNERKAVVTAIEGRFKKIIKILGYESKPRDSDEFYDARGEGTKGEDEGIFLIASNYRTAWKRVEISGTYPKFTTKEGRGQGGYVEVWYDRDKDGGKYERVPQPSITVSLEKTDEQIAKDIERRLLPAYLDRLARVRARIKEDAEYNAKTDSTLESIKAILTGGRGLDKYETERKEFYTTLGDDDGPRVSVKVSGSDATLEIRCGRELAETLARFIKKEA